MTVRKGGRKTSRGRTACTEGQDRCEGGNKEEARNNRRAEGSKKIHATNETGRQVNKIKWKHLVVQVGGKLDPNGCWVVLIWIIEL